MNKFIISNEDNGRTLLKYLQRMFIELPLSRIERALREKDILINSKRIKDKNTILKLGDEVVIYGIDIKIRETPKQSSKISFSVVYEDENILVINKPAKIPMHDESGNSLDAQVLKYLNFIKVDSFIPTSIGRLDKVTSGLLIYGKNYKTIKMFNEKQFFFIKQYVFKSDFSESKIVSVKIEHDENLQKEIISEKGKEATTKFYCSNQYKIAELVTGRKHQIRVTLQHLGHPIFGDVKYGGKKASRVYLHSYCIVLNGLEDYLSYLNGKKLISDPGWNQNLE